MSVSMLVVSIGDHWLLGVTSDDVFAPRGDPSGRTPPHKESADAAGKLRLRDALLER
jgi:hypothetical protein